MGFESQPSFALDDGTGLRVVRASFDGEQKFDWNLFRGYEKLRVLTYSASINAIVRMLDQYSLRFLRVRLRLRDYPARNKNHSGLSAGCRRRYPRRHYGSQ